MADDDAILDLAFLNSQTHGDAALARDVLTLFQEQATRLVARLGSEAHAAQTDTAHLLKGSCLGIGATQASTLLGDFEMANPAERRRLLPALVKAFTTLDRVVAARLAAR